MYFKKMKLLVPSTYFEGEYISHYHCNESPQIYYLNIQMNLASGSYTSQMYSKLISWAKIKALAGLYSLSEGPEETMETMDAFVPF